MIYVHVDEKNKPYLDAISLEPQDGYLEKEDLSFDEMATLFNFTSKCWIDKDGNIQVSKDRLMTDAEKQNEQLSMQLKMIQSQFLNMMLALAKGGAK